MTFAGRALEGSYRKRGIADLKAIQMIYQLPDVALNPRQTVGETISRPLSFYRGLKGTALQAELHRLLSLIGLPDEFAERLPDALSGGQKQRVCIARALAAEPDLLICDEVTSALDPLIAEDILNLLRRLQDELGITYLFITHDLSVVRRLAERTVVMQKGRIVEDRPTAELFQTPQAAYTRTLLESVPELRQDWLDDIMTRRAR